MSRSRKRDAVSPAPLACALTALLMGWAAPAYADDELPVHRWREVWTGADVSSDVWLVYSGVTIAPASHIHGDGVRFRVAGGYGHYRYSGERAPKPGEAHAQRTSFRAVTGFGDVLVGYLKRYGPLTAKAFVGASIITHDIRPFDEENLVIGDDWGAKGVVELWLNIGSDGWGSLDMSWSSAHNTRSLRTRLGYRVLPTLSVGVEGGLNVDGQADCDVGLHESAACKLQFSKQDGSGDASLLDYARAGSFIRYEWAGGEVSVSGGALGATFKHDQSTSLSPYVTVNLLTQF